MEGQVTGWRRWGALVAVCVFVATACTPSDGPIEPAAEPELPPAPSSSAADDLLTVEIFLANEQLDDTCGAVFPVQRNVTDEDRLRGTVETLLAGPTAQEVADGYGGWFSEETVGLLRSVQVVDGIAHIDLGDLRDVIPNASTSCGSAGLLAQLDATVLGVAPDAQRVLYSLDGDVEAFYSWLQLGTPGNSTPPPPQDATADSDEDDGSGDASATVIEDGMHAVYVHGIDLTARTITVDVIQFLTGDEAIAAHEAAHPDDPEGPPNDYFIVNSNPLLRTLPVQDPAEVLLVRLPEDGDADTDPGTWEELPDYLATQGPSDDARLSWSPFWVTVEGGKVTRIEEQYLP